MALELTPEVIGAAAVGAVVIIGAIGNYLRSLRSHQPTESIRAMNPVLAGIGLGFGEKEQQERVIKLIERITLALEALADRRQREFEDMHKDLLDRIDDMQERRKEQEEPRRRPDPPRRR